jgi:hypothetical protein
MTTTASGVKEDDFEIADGIAIVINLDPKPPTITTAAAAAANDNDAEEEGDDGDDGDDVTGRRREGYLQNNRPPPSAPQLNVNLMEATNVVVPGSQAVGWSIDHNFDGGMINIPTVLDPVMTPLIDMSISRGIGADQNEDEDAQMAAALIVAIFTMIWFVVGASRRSTITIQGRRKMRTVPKWFIFFACLACLGCVFGDEYEGGDRQVAHSGIRGLITAAVAEPDGGDGVASKIAKLGEVRIT